NFLGRFEQRMIHRSPRPRLFRLAVLASILAAVLCGITLEAEKRPWPAEIVFLVSTLAFALFCLVAWFPRRNTTLKLIAAHAACAVGAGAVGGGLLAYYDASFKMSFLHFDLNMAIPVTLLSGDVAVLIYMFLMGPWISRATRDVIGRFCVAVLSTAIIWFL